MIRQCRILGSWSEDRFVGTSPTTASNSSAGGGGGGGSVPYILCLFISESSQGTAHKNAVKGEAKIIYNSFNKITIQLWNQSLSSLYGRRRSEHSFLNFVTSKDQKERQPVPRLVYYNIEKPVNSGLKFPEESCSDLKWVGRHLILWLGHNVHVL